jgi:hypothetical protein
MSEQLVSSYPTQRRRISQRQEAELQVRLADLLPFLLPAGAYWTMLENKPRGATAGAMQKRRGVRSGQPDLWVLHSGKTVCIELKSIFGVMSRTQKAMRKEILAAGGDWWLARSERAVVMALHLSGVRLRARSGGRFHPPKLPPWEMPTNDPSLFKPLHPAAVAQQSSARQRQRERVRQQRRALWEAEEAEQSREADDGEAVIVPVMDERAEALRQARLQREPRVQERLAAERLAQERLEQERLERTPEPESWEQAPESESDAEWAAELDRLIAEHERKHG